jgi:hypothetical protein
MLVADQPDNLNLCGYNLNDRLNDPEVFQARAYDLIHSRCIGAGIKSNRWTSYIRDMKLLLRRNGWIQIVEYYLNIQSSSGRLNDHSAVRRWWLAYAEALSRMSRDPRIGTRLQHLFTEARLADVRIETMQLPIGDWETGDSYPPLSFFAHLRGFSKKDQYAACDCANTTDRSSQSQYWQRHCRNDGRPS